MFNFFKKKELLDPHTLRISESDHTKVMNYIASLRNSYHKSGFSKFKNKYPEWFRNNPNVFTIPKRREIEFEDDENTQGLTIINRDYSRIKCPSGESPRSLYGESHVYEKYEEVYFALMDDIKSYITNYSDKLVVDDGGDWDTGSIEVCFNYNTLMIIGDAGLESVDEARHILDSVIISAESEDRARTEREESVQIACKGIQDIFSHIGKK